MLKLPQTTHQRRYDHFVKAGLDAYKKAVESKSTKKTTALVQQSLDYFSKAVKMTDLVAMEDRIPYLNEYFVLNYAILANTLSIENKIEEAILTYQKALNINEKTLNNQETLIRDCFISTEISKLYIYQKNKILAEKNLWRILKNTKKLEDIKKAIKYLLQIRDFFIQLDNQEGIKQTWKMLLKIATKGKEEDLVPIRAEIYEQYGRFLVKNERQNPHNALKQKKRAKKYWKKAILLYNRAKLSKKTKKLEKLIDKL